MSKKNAVQPTVVTVRRQFLEGGEPASLPEEKTEVIEVHRFVVEPAKVQVGRGLTLNMGNYESARLDVGIEVPCYVEEVDSAYEWARRWVEKRIGEEHKSIKGHVDKKKSGSEENPF